MIIWDCTEARRYLPGLIRDEISDRIRRELSQHLSDCVECSSELELMKSIFVLRDIPPAGLSAKIKMAIRTDTVRMEVSSWKRLLPAASFTALLVSASLIEKVLFLPDVSLLEEDLFVNVWPSEDYDLAGSLVLENLSEENLNLLFEEIR